MPQAARQRDPASHAGMIFDIERAAPAAVHYDHVVKAKLNQRRRTDNEAQPVRKALVHPCDALRRTGPEAGRAQISVAPDRRSTTPVSQNRIHETKFTTPWRR